MDLMTKTLAELREIAKAKGIKGVTALRKRQLAEKIAEAVQEEEKQQKKSVPQSVKRPVEKKTDRRVDKPAARTAEKKQERRPVRRQTRSDYSEHTERPVRAEHTERQVRTEYTERTERPVRTERAERQERPGRVERTDRGERTEERRERYEQHDRVSQNYHYNSNHTLRYHDGSDGLISIVKDRQIAEVHPTELKEIDSGITKRGILEIMPESYGFIRCDNFLPGENDVYVAPQFIRRFGLRTGDIIEGNLKTRNQNEKFSALLYMKKVNDRSPSYLYSRKKFEDLTPVFPDYRIHLETPGAGVSMRMLDLIAPIGKGQRGMIVSQPKTGKTTLLKQVAKAVTQNYPKMNLIILLIDERPEEVTDIKESIEGEKVEVIYSTFDELPENHKRVSEMVIERAKRLVESGEDVMILLDSITRLARAYNLTVTPSGRTLSGGLDPAALHMPKRFFGAARNMREGGSLTILATALVDTGSRMDDVVFEEFKGTGNMELVLDRSLSEKRIFPAIDIQKSSTRREDLLLNREEQEVVVKIRKALSGMKSEQALEQILNLFRRTRNNEEFIETVKKMHL